MQKVEWSKSLNSTPFKAFVFLAHFSPRVYSSIRDAVVESLLLLSVGCGTAQSFKQPPLTPSRPASVPRSAGSSRHMPVNPSRARSSSKSSGAVVAEREESSQTPISTVLSSSWDVGEVNLNLIRYVFLNSGCLGLEVKSLGFDSWSAPVNFGCAYNFFRFFCDFVPNSIVWVEIVKLIVNLWILLTHS